jgi:hypothetical protein
MKQSCATFARSATTFCFNRKKIFHLPDQNLEHNSGLDTTERNLVMTDAESFLAALGADMPPDERLILCGFPGDPNNAPTTAWRPRPWRLGGELVLPEAWNGYVTVGSFRRAADGSFRRRTETFAAGRALMVDDVGTKVDRAVVAGVPPTLRIETSPGNEQWWYLLSEPERDAARFDGVIRAFISGKLLGADPGMSGVTRVGRLPGFLNGKAAYGGWRVQLREASGRRYTCDELLAAFGLQINGRRQRRERLQTEEALERNRAYTDAYKFLAARRMLKREEPDPSGWTEMTCPWLEDHTAGADTGAAVREPAEENEFYGAFRCHHGHCADRGWAELTDWINDQALDELEAAAAREAA